MAELRYKITVEVIVDTESIGVSDSGQIEICYGCGDSYDSTQEFFEHQLSRDLQFIEIDEKTLTIEKI